MLQFLLTGLLLTASLPTHADGTEQGILVVYLGADDCPWCAWWESPLSGQEVRFKASPEFKQLQYRAVKNTALAKAYVARDFPADLQWVYAALPEAERRPPRPSFLVFRDGKLQGRYQGAAGWQETGYAMVRKLLANKD